MFSVSSISSIISPANVVRRPVKVGLAAHIKGDVDVDVTMAVEERVEAEVTLSFVVVD